MHFFLLSHIPGWAQASTGSAAPLRLQVGLDLTCRPISRMLMRDLNAYVGGRMEGRRDESVNPRHRRGINRGEGDQTATRIKQVPALAPSDRQPALLRTSLRSHYCNLGRQWKHMSILAAKRAKHQTSQCCILSPRYLKGTFPAHNLVTARHDDSRCIFVQTDDAVAPGLQA